MFLLSIRDPSVLETALVRLMSKLFRAGSASLESDTQVLSGLSVFCFCSCSLKAESVVSTLTLLGLHSLPLRKFELDDQDVAAVLPLIVLGRKRKRWCEPLALESELDSGLKFAPFLTLFDFDLDDLAFIVYSFVVPSCL